MRTRWDTPKDFCSYGLKARSRGFPKSLQWRTLFRRLNVAIGDGWWG